MQPVRWLASQVPAIRRLRDARDQILLERDAAQRDLDEARLRLEETTQRLDDAQRAAKDSKAELDLLRARPADSPFFHYNARFDPQEIMRRHAATGLVPRPGLVTNFLGVLIDPKYFPAILMEHAGQVEPIPIPANWHADIAEWGAALRAVDLARDRFTVMELGCGWGCWLNNTGVAARRAGLNVQLIGVEGDPGHIRFAEEACDLNGFSPSRRSLHHGIAAAKAGFALFPRQEKAGMTWGLEPVFGATEEQRGEAVRSGDHDELPMLALADIAAPHPRIDLLHVDIQGGEADLIAGSLALLREKVAYILIGTHSRQIEGRLFEMLLGQGWTLEIERPATLNLHDPAAPVVVDGVQGWRNPALLA
jgi:FkbM family methyltransferase